jgi:hypothetical protein
VLAVFVVLLSALGLYLLLTVHWDGGSPTTGLTSTRARSSDAGAGFALSAAGPVAAAVRWRGGRLAGVVYFTAGPDPLSTDVYRMQGALADAERLTRSTDNLGISWMTAQPGKIVVASGRAGGVDHIETLEQFQRRRPNPGIRGSSPALDTDGTLAYTVSGRRRGEDLIVKLPKGPARRILHVPQSIPVWGPAHRLYVADNRRLGGDKRRRPCVISGFGSHRPRIIRLPGRSVDGIIAVSRRGEIASSDKRGHLTINPRRGPARRFTLPWIPMSWSPDGRRLLVLRARDAYHGGRQVGLLDPANGAVRRVGSVSGGTVNSAVWLPSD